MPLGGCALCRYSTSNHKGTIKTYFVFAPIFAALLVAALSMNPVGDGMKFADSASYSEDSPANYQSLQASPRIINCGEALKVVLTHRADALQDRRFIERARLCPECIPF